MQALAKEHLIIGGKNRVVFLFGLEYDRSTRLPSLIINVLL